MPCDTPPPPQLVPLTKAAAAPGPVARLLGAAGFGGGFGSQHLEANDFNANHFHRLQHRLELADNIEDAAANRDTIQHATSRTTRDAFLGDIADNPDAPGWRRHLQQANEIGISLRDLDATRRTATARAAIARAAERRTPTAAATKRVEETDALVDLGEIAP